MLNDYKVLLPIKVPRGKYCTSLSASCEHFDNTGGHAKCDFGLEWMGKKPESIQSNINGYLKPKYCLGLKPK